MMIERFAEICEIRNLKVNGYKSTVSSVRRVAGARNLQLQCAMVLHESLLVPVLTYEGRRRGLGLGLYSSTSSEVCYVSGDWIKSRIKG